MADVNDGPLVFLVDKGLPPIGRGRVQCFSVVNVSDRVVILREMHLLVRPADLVRERDEKALSGTYLHLLKAGDMHTLQPMEFVTKGVTTESITKGFGTAGSSADDGMVSYIILCSLFLDEKDKRIGWFSGYCVSKRHLMENG